MNLKDALDLFLTDYPKEKRLSTRTLSAYRKDLEQFLEVCKPDLPLENLNADSVKHFVEWLRQGSFTDASVKRKIASLKVFFNYLEFNDHILVSPLRKLKITFEEETHMPEILSTREVHKLLQSPAMKLKELEDDIKKHPQDTKLKRRWFFVLRDRAILELLYSTGMRIGELSMLNINDVDLTDKTVRIYGRGGRERLGYFASDDVKKILNIYLNERRKLETEDNAMFLNRKNSRLSIHSIENIFRKYVRTAGIKRHITPHSLRHTVAAMLLKNGADIRLVQNLLGHASITTTQIYTEIVTSTPRNTLKDVHQRSKMQVD